jgi:TetR/AcrR family transcriptional regulator, tetracycline repressor protein
VPKQSRQPWGSLSRQAIVDAALHLVDTGGMEALSMPRLARHLGTGVMTLYGHVANKADLIDALAERVLGELQAIDGGHGDWQQVMAEHMRGLRQAVLAHPALGQVLAARGLATPSVFRHLEAALGVLRSAGFDRPTAVRIYYALLNYTLGFLAWEIPRVHRQSRAAYRKQWREALATLPPTAYPTLHDLADDLADAASDGQFEAGLNALLRGFGKPPR